MEQILMPSQVATLLQIHMKTLYRLAEKGIIPGSRSGGGWRFSRKDILKLVSHKQRNGSWVRISPGVEKRNLHG